MINRTIPDVTLKTRVRDETVDGPNPFRWEDFKVHDRFAGKKVAIFSLPGAFTPTCSNLQTPGYEQSYEAFRTAGVDEVYCLSVNDAFVKSHLGFGLRSWRYAMIVDDNVITHWFEEPGINDDGSDSDPYGETAPEKLLEALGVSPPTKAA